MGIERIAMLKYGIPDLRTFFDSDLRWLRHYGFLPLDVPSLVAGSGAMKTTLGWLKTHLDDHAPLDEIVRTLVMRGLEVESIENRAKDLAPFRVARVVEGGAASQCRQAQALPRRYRRGRGAGRVRRAQCARRHARRLRAARRGHPAHRPSAEGERHPRRRSRTACCARATRLGLSEDHEGIIELPDGLHDRQRLRRGASASTIPCSTSR